MVPNHPFLQIPVLNDEKLLGELEKLVTLEPAGTVKKPSGVPPSVLIRDEVRDAVKLLHKYRSDVEWLKENLSGIVKNAIEERATENGNITATFVAGQVDEIRSKMLGNQDKCWGECFTGLSAYH